MSELAIGVPLPPYFVRNVMKINEKPYHPEFCDVLYNHFMLRAHGPYMDSYKAIDEANLSCVNAFKKVFGRQKKTAILGSQNRRFFIWTFSNETCTLYALVHNVKGIVWEFPYQETPIEGLFELFMEANDKLKAITKE